VKMGAKGLKTYDFTTVNSVLSLTQMADDKCFQQRVGMMTANCGCQHVVFLIQGG